MARVTRMTGVTRMARVTRIAKVAQMARVTRTTKSTYTHWHNFSLSLSFLKVGINEVLELRRVVEDLAREIGWTG